MARCDRDNFFQFFTPVPLPEILCRAQSDQIEFQALLRYEHSGADNLGFICGSATATVGLCQAPQSSSYQDPGLIRRYNELRTQSITAVGVPRFTHLHNFHSREESDGVPVATFSAAVFRSYLPDSRRIRFDPSTQRRHQRIVSTMWYHTIASTYRENTLQGP